MQLLWWIENEGDKNDQKHLYAKVVFFFLHLFWKMYKAN